VKSLEDKNRMLKNMVVKSNVHHITLKENIIEELKTLKAANDQEIQFFKTNYEALKVRTNFKFRICC